MSMFQGIIFSIMCQNKCERKNHNWSCYIKILKNKIKICEAIYKKLQIWKFKITANSSKKL